MEKARRRVFSYSLVPFLQEATPLCLPVVTTDVSTSTTSAITAFCTKIVTYNGHFLQRLIIAYMENLEAWYKCIR